MTKTIQYTLTHAHCEILIEILILFFICRFVTSGGPSVNKLMPGDQILQINGEDVKKAPRDHVIQLVRNCRETVSLIVCQPPLDNVSFDALYILFERKGWEINLEPNAYGLGFEPLSYRV